MKQDPQVIKDLIGDPNAAIPSRMKYKDSGV